MKTGNVYVFDELDSTSAEARRRLQNGQTEPFCVVARTQTAGRGRRGKTFFSPRGGVYLSVAFEPASGDVARLTCRAALVTAHAVEKATGLCVGIKWVNDLELDGKKIAGILCERVGAWVIVGVGINLGDAAFPPDLADRAASLCKPEAYDHLCKTLSRDLLSLALPGTPSETDDYRRRLTLTGKAVTYTQNGTPHTGTVLGVDDACRLLVRENGITVALDSGEVSVRTEA